jgi:hypothetical protein
LVTQGLVPAVMLLLVDIAPNVDSGFPEPVVFSEVNLFLFQAAPVSLDMNVIVTAAFAGHAKKNTEAFSGVEPVVRSELAALILIQNLRQPVLIHTVFEELDAGLCL